MFIFKLAGTRKHAGGSESCAIGYEREKRKKRHAATLTTRNSRGHGCSRVRGVVGDVSVTFRSGDGGGKRAGALAADGPLGEPPSSLFAVLHSVVARS